MFNKKRLAIATAVLLPAVSFSGALNAASNEELTSKVKMLEAQLAELRQLVTQQGAKQQALETTVSQKADVSKSDTTFNYGGFVKFDAIQSDYSGGERATAGIGDDILVPSTIPVGGEDGSARFDASIKTSRFWFKTNTQTSAGDIRTHFELDMLTGDGDERISNSSHSRIRHAYVAWDYDENSSVLLGQTWSTFMATLALPEAVDFIGPTSGIVFNRQAQVRWTHKLSNGGKFMVALENPSTGVIDGGGGLADNNYDDNRMPDVVLRYDGFAGKFAYTAAVIGREITYDTGTSDESDVGFGVSLSGKYAFENGDDIKFQLNHGNLGRYVALQAFRDAAVEADGGLDLLDVTGGYVAYRHFWTDKLRSTLSYAITSVDNPDSVSTLNNESVSNYSANLFYSPTKKLSFGMEFLKAERELENGDSGELKRLQFTGKYVF